MARIVMKLLFILVCSLHLVGGRCKVIKNGFEGDTSDKRFLDNVVNEKRNLLSRRPEIAETETTRSLIAREYRTSKEPLVGVIVENYSKYRLQKQRSHRVKTNLSSVDPGTSELFVCEREGNGVENGVGGDPGDLRGGISWQISHHDGSPLTDVEGRSARLLIKFHVKYRKTCELNAAEPNRFKVAFEYFEMPHHHLEMVEEYASKDHDMWSSGDGTGGGTVEALNRFDIGKGAAILIDAVMESGCKPLFTLRIAPASEDGGMLWTGSPSSSSSSVAVVDDPEPYSFLQTFVYICVFASVAALVLVAVYFAVRKYRRGKSERGSGWPYQIVGSRVEQGPHLLGDNDSEDDEDD